MKTASDLADWWEEQRRISTEWSHRELDEFVEKNPGTVSVILATAAQTLVEFPMVLGSGMVDTLNLGKGAAQGGWGWAQDGLRLLSAVAPLARGGRTLLSRVVKFADDNLDNCTWIAATKALRETGTRHFGVLEDLMQAAGKASKAETAGGSWVNEVTPFLKQLGARVKDLPDPQTMDDIVKAAKAAPDGVVMFSVEWAGSGHTLLAQYHPLQGVRIADRTGVIVKSLAELTKFYGPGIATAKPYGSMALIEAAKLIKGLNVSGLAGMLGLELIAVLSPEVKQQLKQEGKLPKMPTAGVSQRRIKTTHVVAPGDWLSKIAIRHYNDMNLWPLIYDFNAATIGPDYNKIKPGQMLKIADLGSYTPAELADARARAKQWHLGAAAHR
jgi:nucleoid-associated protein YgaU